MLKYWFETVMVVLIMAVICAAVWCNLQVKAYGEAKYKQGWTEATEFCLELKNYEPKIKR